MIRILVVIAALAPSGCLDWQAAYDHAARRECGQLADSDERQACLNQVQTNSSEQRAGKRSS